MGHYMVTCQGPTAITHSLVASVTGKDAVNLIFARPNRIEIHLVMENGLKGLHDVPIYGNIACMDVFRVPGESQDMIFILTEMSHFCILSYDANKSEIRTRGLGDMSDHISQQDQEGKQGVVDPKCRMVALHIYEGVLKIIPVDPKGQVRDSFNVFLEEPCIIDVKFLYGCSKPTIAILYEDNNECRWIKTHVVSSRGRELLPGPWERIAAEHTATTLINVPEPLCGIMVIGKSSISYHKGTNTTSMDMVSRSITAYGRVDEDGQRFLVGDTNGELHVITLTCDGTSVKSVSLEPLGTSTIPSCISYLDNGVVFIGSISGDSQLVKLKQVPDKETGSYVEVLDTFVNLGPIVDMVLADVDHQGQHSAVTCSGIAKEGSLRIIQSGIGINELASIELPGIKNMWPLRPSSDARHDKYLVQAFLTETRVLAIENDEMDEVELPSFLPGRTLFCGNMNGDVIIQVTEHALVCLRTPDMVECARWCPPMGLNITIAVANSVNIIVACGGGTLVLLEVDANTHTVVQRGTVKLDHEIACLCLNAEQNFLKTTILGEGGEGGGGSCDNAMDVGNNLVSEEDRGGLDGFVAVATWTDKTIRLLSLPDLSVRAEQILGMDTQARSVALVAFEEKHYLVVGLGDGTVLSFQLDVSPGSRFPSLGSHKKVVLGTKPTGLTPIVSKGSTCIFVTSDHPTVMHSQGGKLMYASVSMTDISSICHFHSKNFPDCLALANATSLTIGMIDEIQKLHIRTVPLGMQPRRISYINRARLFTVLISSSGGGHDQEGQSCVLFLDDKLFNTIRTYVLDPCEEATSSCVATLGGTPHRGNGGGNDGSDSRGKNGSSSSSSSSSQEEYIIVGTAYLMPGPDNFEPTSGRILVFRVKGEGAERQVHLVTEKEIDGCAYCMEAISGNLAVGCNNQIDVYTLQETSGRDGVELIGTVSFKGQILSLCMRTYGDFILVGDLMRSMILLSYNSAENTIKEIARDFTANWMNAVEVINDEMFIGAENDGNLFVLKKNLKSITEEERARLELRGDFHSGEFINVFRRGTLVHNPSGDEENTYITGTQLLYGTVSGSIGAILNLTPEGFNLFSVVEKAMEKVVQGVGGLKHSDWRAFHNARRVAVQSFNFVDGDLVESFLDLKHEHQKKVLQNIHGMAETKVPLANSEDTKEEDCDGNNIEGVCSWKAIMQLTVDGLTQAIESIARQH